MVDINDWFAKIKEVNEPDEINDFLIEIGNDPQLEFLSFLNHFIEHPEKDIYEHIKMNLIYDLGQIGKLLKLEDTYIDYLINEYYKSDRWIRNEIISVFNKISEKNNLSEKVLQLIGASLNEDYIPIKSNAIKVLLNVNNIPELALKNILNILNQSNEDLLIMGTKILRKNIISENALFDLLNNSENYKILKKKAIRVLLMEYFKSLFEIERFREKILSSDWMDQYRLMFLKEIDIFQRLLLKNL